MIHLLFTGGTISMQRDRPPAATCRRTAARRWSSFAPGLDAIAPYRIENWARLPACHLGPDRLWALRERVREIAEGGEVRRHRDHPRDRHHRGDRVPARPDPARRRCRWRSPARCAPRATTAGTARGTCSTPPRWPRARERGRGARWWCSTAGSSPARPRSRRTPPISAAFSAPHAAPIGRVEGGPGRATTPAARGRARRHAAGGLTARGSRWSAGRGRRRHAARPGPARARRRRDRGVRQRQHAAGRGAGDAALAGRRQAGRAGHAAAPTAR